MPDVHYANNCCVGFTSTIHENYVMPCIIGHDIGCGVLTIELPYKPN